MSILARLLGRRAPARDALRDAAIDIVTDVVKRAAEGAATMEQIRERLAQSAHKGDLDDVVQTVIGARRIAELYVKTGKTP
jgi:hypothetical protein